MEAGVPKSNKYPVTLYLENLGARCFKCKSTEPFTVYFHGRAHNQTNLMKIGKCNKCGTGCSRVTKEVFVEPKAETGEKKE